MRSGVVAEFPTPEDLLAAHDLLRRAGYTRLRSWTPYPVRGVIEKLPPSKVPWIMLGAGICGAVFAYAIQWWCNAVDYPLNVGGRPLDSIPAFIPITFETTVLASAVTGFFAALAFSGLPRLSHPLFEIDVFERATVDRFWLGVDDADPRFDADVADHLRSAGALRCERLGPRP